MNKVRSRCTHSHVEVVMEIKVFIQKLAQIKNYNMIRLLRRRGTKIELNGDRKGLSIYD